MVNSSKDASSLASGTRHGDQAADIADILRNDIVSGALAADSVIRQQAMAERFGVSRMPVREALRALEAEGLISFTPNKGAMVAPLNAADLREIYEMRIAAEALALRLALPELTNAQIDRAADIQNQMEQAPLAEFGNLNASFHMALYQPCQRPRLLDHLRILNHAADRYLRITIGSLDYDSKSHCEHHALLDACRLRDGDAAIVCLTHHISDAGEALIAHLNEVRL